MMMTPAGSYRTLTLLDACYKTGLPAPVSEEDLFRTFRILRERGLRHNLEDEPVWLRWYAAVITTSAEYVELQARAGTFGKRIDGGD